MDLFRVTYQIPEFRGFSQIPVYLFRVESETPPFETESFLPRFCRGDPVAALAVAELFTREEAEALQAFAGSHLRGIEAQMRRINASLFGNLAPLSQMRSEDSTGIVPLDERPSLRALMPVRVRGWFDLRQAEVRVTEALVQEMIP